jgi:hypothetical protein
VVETWSSEFLNVYFERGVRRCAKRSQCCEEVRRDFVRAEKSQRERLSCFDDLVPGRLQKASGVEHWFYLKRRAGVNTIFYNFFKNSLRMLDFGLAETSGAVATALPARKPIQTARWNALASTRWLHTPENFRG